MFTITIRDDIPTVHASATSGTSVIVDETAGLQNDDTTSSSVINLFNSVANKGTDPDMTTQYAHGSNAIVSASITIGADEGGSAHWSLSINGGNGIDSGLMTTEGKHIFLFEQNGLIVGRYEAGGNPDPAESNDAAAFAIAIDEHRPYFDCPIRIAAAPGPSECGRWLRQLRRKYFHSCRQNFSGDHGHRFRQRCRHRFRRHWSARGFQRRRSDHADSFGDTDHTVTHDETPGVQTSPIQTRKTT